MRTASTQELITLLNSGKPFLRADLYTFTLDEGTVIRYADWDRDITVGIITYPSGGPAFKRNMVTFERGLTPSELEMTVAPHEGDLIKGVAWLTAAKAGMLDGTEFTLDIAFFDPTVSLTNAVGTINWFTGLVSNIPTLTRSGCTLSIKNELERLDTILPRNLYQPGCLNTLYDSVCGVDRASKIVTTTIASVISEFSFAISDQSHATGYFDQGTVQITSGSNTGVKRTVKSYQQIGSIVAVYMPFAYLPQAGNTIEIVPGCDKTMQTCTNKFSNLTHFRGIPFVPVPDSIL